MILVEFYCYDPTTGRKNLLRTEEYEFKSVAEHAADLFCARSALFSVKITEANK